MESLNNDPNQLKTITIEIYRFLINCEYIDFFMQMYLKYNKDDCSASSYQKMIILCLPSFEKLTLSQLELYIETQTMTQCFVFRNCKNTILIRSAEGKEEFFVFYTC